MQPVGPDGKTIPTLCAHPPHDPWGREYLYDLAGGAPRVTCLGSDGQPGGEGEAADLQLGLEEG